MNDQYKNSYKATAKELVSLSVYNVGYQLCDAGYQWGPGIRDHYLIHYVISGKGTYEVNNETHFLSAEDAFLVYPNTEIIYRADAKRHGNMHGSDLPEVTLPQFCRQPIFPANIHVFMQFPTAKKSNVSFCISMMPEETDLNMPLK